MLSVTGLNRFYYIPGFTDMCKHSRILSIIREQLRREPEDGDVFIVMCCIFTIENQGCNGGRTATYNRHKTGVAETEDHLTLPYKI